MDHFHGINAKPRIKCELCGGSCRRLLGTGAGIIFKGSGFYETDYKSKSGKPSDVGSTKSDSKSESKSESKTPTDSKSSESKSSSKKETSKDSK